MINKELFERKKIEFEKGMIFANNFNNEEAFELIKIYQAELEKNRKELEDTNISIANLKNKLDNINL